MGPVVGRVVVQEAAQELQPRVVQELALAAELAAEPAAVQELAAEPEGVVPAAAAAADVITGSKRLQANR